jgi:protoheme IX farnesyltransferase
MSLVVTARSPVQEAHAGLVVRPALVRARPGGALAWLAVLSAGAGALSLIGDGAARSAPSLAWLSTAAVASDVLAGLLTLGACATAWLARRDDAALLMAVTLAVVFSAMRALVAGVLLSLEAAMLADITSLGLGLLAQGCLVWAAAASLVPPAPAAREASARTELFRRVAEVTALVLFGVGLTGVTVRAVGASWACSGVFPDCNGLGVLPLGRDPLADLQLYHRLLAYVAVGLVFWLSVEAFRTQGPRLGRASLVLAGAMVVEGGIGAASVSLSNPPLAQALHTAGAVAAWSSAVGLVALSRRLALPQAAVTRPRIREGRAWARTALAYVQLTKPRVMSLLLATTAAAMVIATRGLPDLGVFLATLVGGALMSGGAGAINHYVDRDIDPLMGRTAWRPIPSGVIAPRAALRFGIGLAVVASAVFIAFVNVLACVLALIGLLGYVFIYTLWLKRSTPSNIVIGGAAGAIPPLVGWAAVTNEIGSLTAWYLFAIIFFWTPPHFWALSLLIRKHYERAGVPMLPVVRGEDETRRQIVLYSLLLVVLTLVLSPFGMMGVVYFAAATVLGGLFIRDALRLWRRATPQAARGLYLYSILYLFALFAAMAVDRVIFSSF